MRKVLVVALASMSIITMLSCSSARMNGFSYRPAHAGPDMGGTVQASAITEEAKEDQASEMPASTSNKRSGELISGETAAPVLDMTGGVPSADIPLLAAIAREQSSGTPVEKNISQREAVRLVAERYAAEKKIELTKRAYRQLDRAARKLERKQADVDWGPQNNLEIFILAAAAVGLVVGIIGAAFGWFIFLVAALVYLYFKLLK